jgi:hypothetical protein
MLLRRESHPPLPRNAVPPHFYRTTELGGLPEAVEAAAARSAHHHDVLLLCQRGMWERELRQFMPPASLRASVDSLLELGLIERLERPALAH